MSHEDAPAGSRARQTVLIRSGPFTISVGSNAPLFWRQFDSLYCHHARPETGGFVDFDIRVERGTWLKLQSRRHARFVFDGTHPFDAMPQDQITALFEWGLNWCVTQTAHRYLILHAGVAARGDEAVLLPGTSGSGKSTLTTALSFSGWRLLSDELALIDRRDGLVYPMPRPLSLKNASIPVIHSLFPQAVIGATMEGTRKGVVALIRPPADSLAASARPARIRRILFPTYDAATSAVTTEVTRGRAFSRLYESAFNYGIAQRRDFDCLADLVEQAPALDLRFGDLRQALPLIDAMFGQPRPAA